ncbi:hypothetical protein M0802_012946 [Mischocyttarus mexicanus]|nr:hypothetical protein M0802_012946 [Mischocyttarus mexicanus]
MESPCTLAVRMKNMCSRRTENFPQISTFYSRIMVVRTSNEETGEMSDCVDDMREKLRELLFHLSSGKQAELHISCS